jgi:copper chaperone
MRNLLYIIIIVAVGISCKNQAEPESRDSGARSQEMMQSEALRCIEISVGGMTCEGCEKAIKGSVGKLDGIASVEASHTDANTIVTFDTTLVSVGEIDEAIAAAGYTVLDHREGN